MEVEISPKLFLPPAGAILQISADEARPVLWAQEKPPGEGLRGNEVLYEGKGLGLQKRTWNRGLWKERDQAHWKAAENIAMKWRKWRKETNPTKRVLLRREGKKGCVYTTRLGLEWSNRHQLPKIWSPEEQASLLLRPCVPGVSGVLTVHTPTHVTQGGLVGLKQMVKSRERC